MTWDIGAIEYLAITPAPPLPLPGIKIRIVGKETNVKITKRKGNISRDVLITVNKDTIVVLE